MPFSARVLVRNASAVQRQLRTIRRRISDPLADTSTARGVMQVVADHTAQMIQSQGRRTWPSLSPRYQRYKAEVRPGRPMMVFDGHLAQALTSINAPDVWTRRPNRVIMSPSIPYAADHQTGTMRLPRRTLVDLRGQDAKQAGRAVRDGIFRGLRNIT